MNLVRFYNPRYSVNRSLVNEMFNNFRTSDYHEDYLQNCKKQPAINIFETENDFKIELFQKRELGTNFRFNNGKIRKMTISTLEIKKFLKVYGPLGIFVHISVYSVFWVIIFCMFHFGLMRTKRMQAILKKMKIANANGNGNAALASEALATTLANKFFVFIRFPITVALTVFLGHSFGIKMSNTQL